VITNVDIHVIVSTIENYENRTVTPIFISNNSVQSTVTKDNAIKQTVIDLAPILPNSRITLFSYSNIQGNVTKNFYLFIYNLFISVMVKYVINRL